ncbi:putative membrane protein [Hymenobacter psychrotolerans DSM 18569]|uniref:Putative membrane protein n=1 Tax=Hymenobacter psychrotolerans DSM 18569 TaxID=1121959 RepID=A0A1M6RL12_9BACT|nr:bestrophin family ion channel [Hymenobacter psychrotolerans]SHK33119.1 putative membrane protein [Hymenobacter psychrotolerans DSM 18569]
MYIRKNLRWRVIWKFSWQGLVVFTLYALLICVLYRLVGFHSVSIPWQPVATLGIAVSFYIGFKNNGSYDRFWEGRQLWGGIVNYSRTWAMQALEYVTSVVDAPGVEAPAASRAELTIRHRRLVYRQIAWCNALRLNLRRQNDQWDEQVAPFLDPAESAEMKRKQNPPAHLLRQQAADLRILREERGLLNDFQHVNMMTSIEQFNNLQGGCERIKNTPFPRQYAFYSFVFVWLFAALLPLGLIAEFEKMGPDHIWLTVPFSVLVSWVFNTIEIVGHTSENPFENEMNDVPMTAICRTIEIDLREMLGETHLPPKLAPVDDILY